MFRKLRRHIFVYDFIFLGLSLFVNFLLNLLDMRFRTSFMMILIMIFIIGIIAGIVCYIENNNKKAACIIFTISSSIGIIFMGGLILLYSLYGPEHNVNLYGKKYVAVVADYYSNVDVDYYESYGPLLMGTKVKVHGYFGSGAYDPFLNPNIPDGVTYTYYDTDEKRNLEKVIRFLKDKNGNKIDEDINIIYDKSLDDIHYDDSKYYILPDDEEILYEKKFDNIILRFGKLDNVIGQRMLVNVMRSKDGGENFYIITKNPIQVSLEAKFIFLNESLGFAISTGKVRLKDNGEGLYFTEDGGETFSHSSFIYKNENVEYMDIVSLPYFEDDKLKIKCSVYAFVPREDSKGSYEDIPLTFISINNGKTWILEEYNNE